MTVYNGYSSPAALLDADVRVDARVARGARQVFVLPVRDVLVAARVSVLLCQTEVDNMDHVLPLAETDLRFTGDLSGGVRA